MKKNHYRIFLHREHKNEYCDLVAIQAAEMNDQSYTPTAEQFFHIIERTLLKTHISGVQATFDDVGNKIFIDVEKDGRYFTGLTLEGIEIIELEPVPHEED